MLSRPLLINVAVAGGMIVTGTLLVFYREVSSDQVITARDTTMTFTTFVLFDMFTALRYLMCANYPFMCAPPSCRSEDKSIFEIGFTSNKAFLWAVGLSLFGQCCVVYLPPLQRVFQTEALNLMVSGNQAGLTSNLLDPGYSIHPNYHFFGVHCRRSKVT